MADISWTENYGAQQSGAWKSVALYDSDVRAQSNDLEDVAARPTDVAMKLPALQALVDLSGLAVTSARRSLFEPGAPRRWVLVEARGRHRAPWGL